MRPAQDDRYLTAFAFCSVRETAEKLGLCAAVRKAAPPELQALLSDSARTPPLIPGRFLDVFYRAVADVHGREAVRTIGLELMHGPVGNLLQRYIQARIALYGRSVPAVLSSLDAIAGTMMRGLRLEFEHTGGRTGVLHLRMDGTPDPVVYAAWEGIAQYFLEFADSPATVAISEATGPSEARIPVGW